MIECASIYRFIELIESFRDLRIPFESHVSYDGVYTIKVLS
jgi:hypothetical protein